MHILHVHVHAPLQKASEVEPFASVVKPREHSLQAGLDVFRPADQEPRLHTWQVGPPRPGSQADDEEMKARWGGS